MSADADSTQAKPSTTKLTPEQALSDAHFHSILSQILDAQLALRSQIAGLQSQIETMTKPEASHDLPASASGSYYTMEEVATILGIDRSTLRSWITTGRIGWSRPGKEYRFTLLDIAQCLDRRGGAV